MKSFVKENWFKIAIIVILLGLLLALLGIGYLSNKELTIVDSTAVISSISLDDSMSTNTPGVSTNNPYTMQIQPKSNNSVDICTNIEGIQTTIPLGMNLSGTTCATISPVNNLIDVCTNIQGVQTSVPAGMVLQLGLCASYSPTSQVIGPPAPQCDFKTYTSSQYGLSFNYPSTMGFKEVIQDSLTVKGAAWDTNDMKNGKTLQIFLYPININWDLVINRNATAFLNILDDGGTSTIRSYIRSTIGISNPGVTIGGNIFHSAYPSSLFFERPTYFVMLNESQRISYYCSNNNEIQARSTLRFTN